MGEDNKKSSFLFSECWQDREHREARHVSGNSSSTKFNSSLNFISGYNEVLLRHKSCSDHLEHLKCQNIQRECEVIKILKEFPLECLTSALSNKILLESKHGQQ